MGKVLRLAIDQPSAGQRLAQDIRHDGWLAMSEPFGSPEASWKASRMVRKRGFEPLRYYYRQPLKLVRLMLATSAFRGLKEICRPDQLVRLYILSTN